MSLFPGLFPLFLFLIFDSESVPLFFTFSPFDQFISGSNSLEQTCDSRLMQTFVPTVAEVQMEGVFEITPLIIIK